MEWIFLDPATVNFVKLLTSLGEIMFFNRLNGKCQLIYGILVLVAFNSLSSAKTYSIPLNRNPEVLKLPYMDPNRSIDERVTGKRLPPKCLMA